MSKKRALYKCQDRPARILKFNSNSEGNLKWGKYASDLVQSRDIGLVKG
jgi:hypothetical protein